MNKPELVAKVARETGVSKTVARKAVNAFAQAVLVGARTNGTVDLAGLGSLSLILGVPPAALAAAPMAGPSATTISLEPSQYLLRRAAETGTVKIATAASPARGTLSATASLRGTARAAAAAAGTRRAAATASSRSGRR